MKIMLKIFFSVLVCLNISFASTQVLQGVDPLDDIFKTTQENYENYLDKLIIDNKCKTNEYEYECMDNNATFEDMSIGTIKLNFSKYVEKQKEVIILKSIDAKQVKGQNISMDTLLVTTDINDNITFFSNGFVYSFLSLETLQGTIERKENFNFNFKGFNKNKETFSLNSEIVMLEQSDFIIKNLSMMIGDIYGTPEDMKALQTLELSQIIKKYYHFNLFEGDTMSFKLINKDNTTTKQFFGIILMAMVEINKNPQINNSILDVLQHYFTITRN